MLGRAVRRGARCGRGGKEDLELGRIFKGKLCELGRIWRWGGLPGGVGGVRNDFQRENM